MTDAQDQPARDSGRAGVLIAIGLLVIWALLAPRREWA